MKALGAIFKNLDFTLWHLILADEKGIIRFGVVKNVVIVLAKRGVRRYLEISKWTKAVALRLEREEWDILEAEVHTSH